MFKYIYMYVCIQLYIYVTRGHPVSGVTIVNVHVCAT